MEEKQRAPAPEAPNGPIEKAQSNAVESPAQRASFFTILGYANRLEIWVQILGTLFAIAAGSHILMVTLILGSALPLMTILLGNFVNLFGGLVSPLTPSLTPPASPEDFKHQVHPYSSLI